MISKKINRKNIKIYSIFFGLFFYLFGILCFKYFYLKYSLLFFISSTLFYLLNAIIFNGRKIYNKIVFYFLSFVSLFCSISVIYILID